MYVMQSGSLVPDPLTELRQFQSQMNRLFGGPERSAERRAATWDYPPLRMWLGDNSVVICTEIPGTATDQINLTVRENTVLIEGTRPEPVSEDQEVMWHRRERPVGNFSRTVRLPMRVDSDQVEARFANGVLTIEMQRPKSDLPRKITVKSD